MASLFWFLSPGPVALLISTCFEIKLAQEKKEWLEEILNIPGTNQDLDARAYEGKPRALKERILWLKLGACF